MHDTQLSSLVKMDDPQAVLDEAIHIIQMSFPGSNVVAIRSAFNRTILLYEGGWPGIRGCNTDYHDLKHATDCFLAMVRLLHGAAITGLDLSITDVHRSIIAALLHDVGYLQNSEDTLGTGAKFTSSHVRRGMDFLQGHFAEWALERQDVHACMAMIHCTDLTKALSTIPFPDQPTETLGKMLATADLLAQMADRTYLEKLLLLHGELEEARANDCTDHLEFLRESKAFYFRMMDRLKNQLSSFNRLMIHHFKARWGIEQDLYQEAIDNQQKYLQEALACEEPLERLRRYGTVARRSAGLN